jgi:hypothetical protein
MKWQQAKKLMRENPRMVMYQDNIPAIGWRWNNGWQVDTNSLPWHNTEILPGRFTGTNDWLVLPIETTTTQENNEPTILDSDLDPTGSDVLLSALSAGLKTYIKVVARDTLKEMLLKGIENGN